MVDYLSIPLNYSPRAKHRGYTAVNVSALLAMNGLSLPIVLGKTLIFKHLPLASYPTKSVNFLCTRSPSQSPAVMDSKH